MSGIRNKCLGTDELQALPSAVTDSDSDSSQDGETIQAKDIVFSSIAWNQAELQTWHTPDTCNPDWMHVDDTCASATQHGAEQECLQDTTCDGLSTLLQGTGSEHITASTQSSTDDVNPAAGSFSYMASAAGTLSAESSLDTLSNHNLSFRTAGSYLSPQARSSITDISSPMLTFSQTGSTSDYQSPASLLLLESLLDDDELDDLILRLQGRPSPSKPGGMQSNNGDEDESDQQNRFYDHHEKEDARDNEPDSSAGGILIPEQPSLEFVEPPPSPGKSVDSQIHKQTSPTAAAEAEAGDADVVLSTHIETRAQHNKPGAQLMTHNNYAQGIERVAEAELRPTTTATASSTTTGAPAGPAPLNFSKPLGRNQHSEVSDRIWPKTPMDDWLPNWVTQPAAGDASRILEDDNEDSSADASSDGDDSSVDGEFQEWLEMRSKLRGRGAAGGSGSATQTMMAMLMENEACSSWHTSEDGDESTAAHPAQSSTNNANPTLDQTHLANVELHQLVDVPAKPAPEKPSCYVHIVSDVDLQSDQVSGQRTEDGTLQASQLGKLPAGQAVADDVQANAKDPKPWRLGSDREDASAALLGTAPLVVDQRPAQVQVYHVQTDIPLPQINSPATENDLRDKSHNAVKVENKPACAPVMTRSTFCGGTDTDFDDTQHKDVSETQKQAGSAFNATTAPISGLKLDNLIPHVETPDTAPGRPVPPVQRTCSRSLSERFSRSISISTEDDGDDSDDEQPAARYTQKLPQNAQGPTARASPAGAAPASGLTHKSLGYVQHVLPTFNAGKGSCKSPMPFNMESVSEHAQLNSPCNFWQLGQPGKQLPDLVFDRGASPRPIPHAGLLNSSIPAVRRSTDSHSSLSSDPEDLEISLDRFDVIEEKIAVINSIRARSQQLKGHSDVTARAIRKCTHWNSIADLASEARKTGVTSLMNSTGLASRADTVLPPAATTLLNVPSWAHDQNSFTCILSAPVRPQLAEGVSTTSTAAVTPVTQAMPWHGDFVTPTVHAARMLAHIEECQAVLREQSGSSFSIVGLDLVTDSTSPKELSECKLMVVAVPGEQPITLTDAPQGVDAALLADTMQNVKQQLQCQSCTVTLQEDANDLLPTAERCPQVPSMPDSSTIPAVHFAKGLESLVSPSSPKHCGTVRPQPSTAQNQMNTIVTATAYHVDILAGVHAYFHTMTDNTVINTMKLAPAGADSAGQTHHVGSVPQSEQVVSVFAADEPQSVKLLQRLLLRAADVGLSLQGVRTFYANKEDCQLISSASQHCPQPSRPHFAIELVGVNAAASRWQQQLGASKRLIAQATNPNCINAWDLNVGPVTCSYNSVAAAREAQCFFCMQPLSHMKPHPHPDTPSLDSTRQMDKCQVAESTKPTATDAGASLAVQALPGAWESAALAMPAATLQDTLVACLASRYLAWCGCQLSNLLLSVTTAKPFEGTSSIQDDQPLDAVHAHAAIDVEGWECRQVCTAVMQALQAGNVTSRAAAVEMASGPAGSSQAVAWRTVPSTFQAESELGKYMDSGSSLSAAPPSSIPGAPQVVCVAVSTSAGFVKAFTIISSLLQHILQLRTNNSKACWSEVVALRLLKKLPPGVHALLPVFDHRSRSQGSIRVTHPAVDTLTHHAENPSKTHLQENHWKGSALVLALHGVDIQQVVLDFCTQMKSASWTSPAPVLQTTPADMLSLPAVVYDAAVPVDSCQDVPVGFTTCDTHGCHVLARCFKEDQVHLDASVHDGVRLPLRCIPQPSDSPADDAESTPLSALAQLLSPPVAIMTGCLVEPIALQGNNLQRLLSFIHHNRFEVLHATMVEPSRALLGDVDPTLQAPSLMLGMLLKRPNAVQWAVYQLQEQGLLSSGIHVCSSLAAAQQLQEDITCAPDVAKHDGMGEKAPSGLKMQLTVMAVLPPAEDNQGVNWSDISEALAALQQQGFKTVGLKYAALSAHQVGLLRQSHGLSLKQANAALTAPTLLLAVQRDDGVMRLQMMVQEAKRLSRMDQAALRQASFSPIAALLSCAPSASMARKEILEFFPSIAQQ